MRSIRELLENEETVWVYFDSEELCEEFFRSEEGLYFGELPRDRWKAGKVIAVHRDGSMGHLPLFIWLMSFSAGIESCPVKVDHRRFIGGEEDFFCHIPHFACRMTLGRSAGA
ncbi:MAG: hypothetical protein IKN66_04620 [Ruminococcus sp.]|nr:hypothetical protein [Ruminococcus sp.]